MSAVLRIRQPDDWHVHLRDGAAMRAVLAHTARCFARAIVMPNLQPPVTTTADARAYRERILAALPAGSRFEPLMTIYLTDRTAPDEVERARDSGIVHGFKLYPAGATTHSEAGVTAMANISKVLERMADCGMVLQVHGEVTASQVDIFDREARFIEDILAPLVKGLPGLRIVFEHITTAAAVDFVSQARDGVAATITPQHLLHNRNALLAGGIRPHFYCLPILKTEPDRRALLAAATGGNPRFFLGTDSAPHARHTKENACGCAGIFSAHAAIELYVEAFELAGRLDRLQAFASEYGADFYRLPRNQRTIELTKSDWTVPAELTFADASVVPMRAGETVHWRLTNPTVAE